jgi:hypothetical protein
MELALVHLVERVVLGVMVIEIPVTVDPKADAGDPFAAER